MSVLIRGVTMPKDCDTCQFSSINDCKLWMIMDVGEIHPECPLVELPDKHGRLIDADALADDLEYDAQHFDEGHELKFNAAMWLRSNQNKVIIDKEGE